MEYVGSFFTQDRNENWKDIIKMMAREQEEEEDSLSPSLAELMVGVLRESRSLLSHFLFTVFSLSFSGKELQRRNKE